MDHVMQPKTRSSMDEMLSSDLFGRDDELASAAGIRNAVLLGAGLWAIIIGGLLRFVF